MRFIYYWSSCLKTMYNTLPYFKLWWCWIASLKSFLREITNWKKFLVSLHYQSLFLTKGEKIYPPSLAKDVLLDPSLILYTARMQILTKDAVTTQVDGVVYYRIHSAVSAVANITDVHPATLLLAQTTLRNVLGTQSLAQLLAGREEIAHSIQVNLALRIHWQAWICVLGSTKSGIISISFFNIVYKIFLLFNYVSHSLEPEKVILNIFPQVLVEELFPITKQGRFWNYPVMNKSV